MVDYSKTKAWLAAYYRVPIDDADFQDRYQDAWECFLRYWNGEGSPLGCLLMMFKRQQQYYKKERIDLEYIGDTFEVDQDPELSQAVLGLEDYASMVYLQQFFDELSDLDRTVLEYRLQGLSYDEIAKELDTNITVVYRSLTSIVPK